MSLQVWLPLNGDLRNNGVANIDITNNGATVNDSGKIGKCYFFNGSNYLKTEYNFYNNKYSISAWIYTTSSTITQTILCNRTSVGYGFSIFLVGGKIRIDPGGKGVQWITSYTYPVNTWFHLVVTYDGSKSSYYINGILQETHTAAINPSYWANYTSIGASQANNSNFDNYLNGKLNDVRIYDHALSAAEVKEISRGLIVHYTMDDNNYYENIIYDTSGNGYNGTIIGTINSDNTSKKYLTSTKFTNNSHIFLSLPTTSAFTRYTFSWYGKFTVINGHMMWGFSNGNRLNLYMANALFYWNTGDGNNNPFSGVSNIYNDGEWHHFAVTGNGTVNKLYIDGNFKANAKTYRAIIGSNIYFNGWANTSSYNFNGSLSDFRLYATVLSDDEIKELYQTSAKIDNTGKLHTYSIVEDSTKSSPSITHQGLTIMNNSTDGFIEDPTLSNLSITKTGQLKATEIIEN